MANRREALDVENQGEGRKPGTTTRYAPAMRIRDEQGKFLLRWSMIFVMSCVFAVTLDPLFFYILIIDQDKKCLQMDKTLSTTVLVLRSLTDFIFFVHFIYKIYDVFIVQKNKQLTANEAANTLQLVASSTLQTGGNLDRKSKRILLWSSLSIINDFLALLPVPQLLIVIAFYKMRAAGYMEHKKALNVFLLGQYLPRIFRIHQSSKELRENAGPWVRGLFNFFLYILASHILGAFWYFFSIQRETSCWYSACANHSLDPAGCMNTFYCGHRTTTSRNITLLNEQCRLDTPDDTSAPFNFGIFLDSLKNHNTEHIHFRKKFLYSFWWGLRNISNFGTNLTTSTYVWENLFAILISIIGLLLFLYLIGNVQNLMLKEATKTKEETQINQVKMLLEATEQIIQAKMLKEATKIKEEERHIIQVKMLGVRKWIFENKFPNHIKNEIVNSIEQTLRKNKDADVDKPFLILPWQTKRFVKRHLFMDTLRTVNKLKDMDERALTLMCDYLKPVTYIENSFVFRMGDPLDFMLFIIEGTIWTYALKDSQVGNGISSMVTKPLRKGHFYGEELLDWASESFTELPVSSKHVKSQTKVEAFVLMAKDLETVVSRSKPSWHLLKCNNPGEVAISTFRRFRPRPPLFPVGTTDANGGSLPSAAGN
ncbi:cyclic nucleotide-gated ion channel 1-like [Pyrus ussuriensis x Pyrus communis]|uniref:Cyclic nucleotide-gated ion channel 1-like n=1 Tax=Pyrus ussuriensis x Pyrus communis TaxID=2448454 RepID=A0A5N5FC30_9ROSA|nr:cyclic nucleotide-gated ion channel 1-like [Pyrus ussuriensis x Pyrus communis]